MALETTTNKNEIAFSLDSLLCYDCNKLNFFQHNLNQGVVDLTSLTSVALAPNRIGYAGIRDLVKLSELFESSSLEHEHENPPGYYYSKVVNIENVIAITYEKSNSFYFIETILEQRNLLDNHKIYDIQSETIKRFSSLTFDFLVISLDEDLKIDSIIENKNVLFTKDQIYA